jgi:hypothetical protein
MAGRPLSSLNPVEKSCLNVSMARIPLIALPEKPESADVLPFVAPHPRLMPSHPEGAYPVS